VSLKIRKESKFLAKHTAIYAIGNFIQKFTTLLLLPVYTRYLTTTEFGIKELIGISVDVIGVLMAGVISSGVLRFYYDYDELKDRNEVISSAVISTGLIGIVIVAILWFFTDAFAYYILDDEGLSYFFQIAFITILFQSITRIGYEYIRANQQSIKFILLSLFSMLIQTSLNVYLIIFVKIGVLGILVSSLISSIAMFLIIVVPMLNKIGLSFSLEKTRAIVKFSYPIVIAQIGAFIVHISDRFFIKEMLSIADAGLYSLSYRLGTLPGSFVSEPFNRTWQARRYELYKVDNSERVFGQIFTYYLLIMFFFGLFISALAKDILIIMSDSTFWSAYKIVPIIVVANIVFCLNSHLNLGILIAKKTKYLAYINFSNSIIVLILNYLLINAFGVYGAAYASLIAFIYKTALTYYFSSKYHKIYFEFLRISKIVFVSGLIYVATIPVQLESIYLTFIVKSMIVLLYPFLLYWIDFFSKEEKKTIINFVRSKLLA
jgi:O-antigen/teichoic acid export membrane protein